MSSLRTALIAASLTAVTVAGTALVTATPASAATRCTTSTKTLDDAAYSGPFFDNWDFRVTLCASRSGSTVSTYAKISWNAPAGMYSCGAGIFDGAAFRLQVKRSTSGTDPIVRQATYYGLRSHLDSGCSHDGSTTTPTLTYHTSSRALADGEVLLDWNNDGMGYHRYAFSASPVV